MTTLLSYLPIDDLSRFLCQMAWQTTLLGVAAWITLRFVIRQPATRAWFALLTMLCFPLIPVVSSAARDYQLGMIAMPTAATSDTMVLTEFPRGTSHGVRPAPIAGRMSSTSPDSFRTGINLSSTFLIAWAALSLVLYGRLILALLAALRLDAQSTTCVDARLLAFVAEASRRVGLRRPPVVLTHPQIRVPMVRAFWKSKLYFPVTMATAHDQDWTAVLCHEMAHIRRRDTWLRLLSHAIIAMIPWQPFLWILQQFYLRSCEECCDDWAINAGNDPVELAAALTDCAPPSPRFALAITGTSNCRRRVVRLLAMKSTPSPTMSVAQRTCSTLILIALVSAVAIAQEREIPARPVATTPLGQDVKQSPYFGRREIVSHGVATPVGQDVKMPPSVTDRHGQNQAAKSLSPLYKIEPPDVLLIEAINVVPKSPYKIQKLDVLQILAAGTLPDSPIAGAYQVEPNGNVVLGPAYGRVQVFGQTTEEAQNTVKMKLAKILSAPQVSVSLLQSSGSQKIVGEHLVGPDGTVNLGIYGAVRINGMTVQDARRAIEAHLERFFDTPKVAVEVFRYNSHVFYVIVDGGDMGDTVTRIPLTGTETVLDALSQIDGLRIHRDTSIVIHRDEKVLRVDWQGITRKGDSKSNYQLLAGDRLFVTERKAGS